MASLDEILAAKAVTSEKVAEKEKTKSVAKDRDRGGVYKDRTPAGVLGAAGSLQPIGRDKPSRGYSYARAIAVAKGMIRPQDAPEEMEANEVLRNTLIPFGYPHTGGFLAVGGSKFLPTRMANNEPFDIMLKFQGEIRQKMLATVPKNYDYDHPSVQAMVHKIMVVKGLATYEEGVKAMGQTTDSLGGTLVPAPAQGEFIEYQRQFESFTRAGATEVPLPPQGRVSYPKQVTGTTAYWVGEAATITSSDAGTSALNLEAKKLGVITTLSYELMRFSDPQVEGIIRMDQALQAGLAADTAMYTGTGGTQIKGLLTYPTGAANAAWVPGTDQVMLRTATTVATDGNTLQPQDFIKLSQALPDPVQAMPKTFLLYTPTAVAIMSRRADAVTAADQAGPFVFEINRDPATGLPPGLYGNKVVTSYNVPSNRVKGAGTNLTILLCGAFSDWYIARSGVVEFDTDPYTNFASVQTRLRTIQLLDAGPRHNASFGYIDSLLPTT
jgi:HK97 family phage major capsid protein